MKSVPLQAILPYHLKLRIHNVTILCHEDPHGLFNIDIPFRYVSLS